MDIEEKQKINQNNVIHNGHHFKSTCNQGIEFLECGELGGLRGDDIWWRGPLHPSIPGDSPQG